MWELHRNSNCGQPINRKNKGPTHYIRSLPEITSRVGIVYSLRDVLFILTVSQAVDAALPDGHSRAGVLATGQNKVGSDVGIFKESHCHEFVIFGCFWILKEKNTGVCAQVSVCIKMGNTTYRSAFTFVMLLSDCKWAGRSRWAISLCRRQTYTRLEHIAAHSCMEIIIQ